jgi:hypothetical protein
MHVLSKEVQNKCKILQNQIINYLLNCDNNCSTFKDMILFLKVTRTRISRNIELIDIEGKYKIKVDRSNIKSITFQLILNEKN